MKLLKYICLSALAITAAGCSDFLEEYSQDKYYVTSWKDLNELLLGDCYMPVYSTQRVIFSTTPCAKIHYLADEIQDFNKDEGGSSDMDGHDPVFGYYTWQQRTGQNETYSDFHPENEDWTQIYKLINVANNIIESAEDVPQNDDEERQGYLKVTGEARFLRAYYYFYLANLYGKPYHPDSAKVDLAVPIKTSSEVEDKKFQRNTVQEVYDLVLSDLLIAEQNLSRYTSPQPSIYRADSVAAQLLLSRVYLYMQNWSKAEEYADKVIKAHPALRNLNTDMSTFAVASNEENIFSMGGDDLPCAFVNATQSFAVDNELYYAYDSEDLRRTLWYWHKGTFTGLTKVAPRVGGWFGQEREPSSSDYYLYMFHNSHEGLHPEVSSMFLMRSAEAYLNKAEALAYQGKYDEARNTVNTLRWYRFRTRADEKRVLKSTGTELIDDIRNERRLELALEGHRWFDLRRYLVCSVHPDSKEIVHYYTYYRDRYESEITAYRKFTLQKWDPAYTLNIPHEVIEFNTGMTQNYRPWRTYEDVEF